MIYLESNRVEVFDYTSEWKKYGMYILTFAMMININIANKVQINISKLVSIYIYLCLNTTKHKISVASHNKTECSSFAFALTDTSVNFQRALKLMS